jgi:hypothetical protein
MGFVATKEIKIYKALAEFKHMYYLMNMKFVNILEI